MKKLFDRIAGKNLLTYDTRELKKGGVYVAREGTINDGHDYIKYAEKAEFIISQKPSSDHKKVHIIEDLEKEIEKYAKSIRDKNALPVVGLSLIHI